MSGAAEKIGKAETKGKLTRVPSYRELHFKNSHAKNKKLQMSFGGCGFLGVYHCGVGKCVVNHAPHLFSEFDSFYGASAGAITAVCAACKSDPMVAYKWVRKTFEDSRKHWFGMLSPFFDLYSRLRVFLDEFLPPNAHMLCRNVVNISLTVVGDKGLVRNWLISDFRTRTELINVIIASSFIPGYAGFKNLPKIRGKRCCDGGITSNIPLVSDPDVITVTPFAGFCDICPQKESCTQHMINICDQPMQLSPSNLYRLAKSLCPTSWKELEDLYHQGYNDCLSFFRKEGLIPDPKIERRKDSSLPSPCGSDDSGIILSTMACDLPGNRRSGHSRITSMTLSASGEFLSCFGGSKKGSFNSITLEEMERGLDLKGTEKATHLMRQYGKEEAHLALSRHRFSDVNAAIVQAGSSGVVSRIMDPPVQIVRISFKGLSWMLEMCYLREIVPHKLAQHWPLSKLIPKDTRESEEDLSTNEGLLGNLALFTF